MSEFLKPKASDMKSPGSVRRVVKASFGLGFFGQGRQVGANVGYVLELCVHQ